MSRFCAKPTCSDLAMTWFETSLEHRRVVRRDTSTKHAIALCPSHADRFKVPTGWTLTTGDEQPADGVPAINPAAAWFLPTGKPNEVAPVELVGTTTASNAGVQRLADAPEGSMLDRAFNGPKTSDERNRSSSKKSDAQTKDQSASDDTEENSDLYQTGEIPFPPHRQASAI